MSFDNWIKDVNEGLEKRNNDRMKIFYDTLYDTFYKDIEKTAKIYTRDKNKFSYKVVSLKSGKYALIDSDNNILFKDESMHKCKVEFIMVTSTKGQ